MKKKKIAKEIVPNIFKINLYKTSSPTYQHMFLKIFSC